MGFLGYRMVKSYIVYRISYIVIGLLILYGSSFTFAQGQITKLTIFPNNLGLVEGVKMIALKKGINEVTFDPVSKGIILDSIYARAEKCEFLEQKYSSDSFLSWKVNSEEEGETLLRVVYLTIGLNWKLNYILEVNEENTFMKIYGWATVENETGIDFSQTSLTLTTQLPLSVEESIFPEDLSKSSSLASLSFLPNISYPISYPMTFKNKEKKRILLSPLSKNNVSITKIYLFDGEKYGEEVREELWFTNKEEEGLGRPLPPGIAYIYEVDSEEGITFIGESFFPRVSPEKEGKIYLGQAKNLEGERVLISMNQESYEEEGHKIILNEYTYRIILYNKRQVSAAVKVVEHFYGELESPVESDPPPYIQVENLIIYKVEIPPQEKKEIEYTARTRSKGISDETSR